MTAPAAPRTAAALALVALAPVALTVAGCSSSEEAQRQEAFCAEVPALLEDITADVDAVAADPRSAPRVVEEAVGRLEAVEPPEAVAADWGDLVTSWRALSDLLGEADLTDPSANAGLAPRLQELQQDLTSSGEAVDAYGRETC
ncbi:hypothetical protein ACI8AA_16455 [Geodermatophilus sp. SYSU D01180]